MGLWKPCQVRAGLHARSWVQCLDALVTLESLLHRADSQAQLRSSSQLSSICGQLTRCPAEVTKLRLFISNLPSPVPDKHQLPLNVPLPLTSSVAYVAAEM